MIKIDKLYFLMMNIYLILGLKFFNFPMLNNNPELKSMYSASDDNTEVLYLSDATATISSFTDAPIIYNF